MTRTVLTFAERTHVFEELKKVCCSVSEGVAEYNEGWDDIRLAAVIGGKCNKFHVRSVRQEMLGRVRTVSNSTDLNKRVTAIEDYLTSKWPHWHTHVAQEVEE